MLGKELDENKYKELVDGSFMSALTLNEVIDTAMGKGLNDDNFWEFAGAYYRLNEFNCPVIIIDREQAFGGYNNSEITLTVGKNDISSNDKKFKKILLDKIDHKCQLKIKEIHESAEKKIEQLQSKIKAVEAKEQTYLKYLNGIIETINSSKEDNIKEDKNK